MTYDYRVLIDSERDGSYGAAIDDVTDDVASVSWSVGSMQPYAEMYPQTQLNMTLVNNAGRYNIASSTSPYSNKLKRGTLIKVEMGIGGNWVTMWSGKVQQVKPYAGPQEETAVPLVSVIAYDPMAALDKVTVNTALQTDVRVDQAIRQVMLDAGFVYPYIYSGVVFGISRFDGTSYFLSGDEYIDLEEGLTTIEYAGTVDVNRERTISARAYIAQLVKHEAGGRFYWSPRDDKFIFHNRHHDAVQSAVVEVFTENDFYQAPMSQGDDVVNKVTLRYSPAELGTPSSVLATYNTDNPITVRAGEERKFRLRYTDPDNEDTRVMATDVIDLVLNTDIVFNPVTPTSYKLFTEIGANSLLVTVVNEATTDFDITTLQVRGTPIYQYQQEEIVVFDTDSIRENDLHERQVNVPIQDATLAENYANHLLNTFKNSYDRVQSLSVFVDNDNAATVQTLTVGQRISIADGDGGHSGEYIVTGEKHSLNGDIHQVVYGVKPATRVVFATFDGKTLFDGNSYFAF